VVAAEAHFIQAIPFILPIAHIGMTGTVRDRRPSTTACPGCRAMGTKKLKKFAVRKIIFCTGLTRAANANQNLQYTSDKCDSKNVMEEDHFFADI
jgi:hypothetical protein